IARTVSKQPKPSPGSNLGSIRPFEIDQPWQPEPYRGATTPPVAHNAVTPPPPTESKNEHDSLDKTSLVFVRKNAASVPVSEKRESDMPADVSIGLAPGTRLRAKLASAISTAVATPVVAIIEYNYEQNAEIVVPAGARVLGRLEAADRSGYITI